MEPVPVSIIIPNYNGEQMLSQNIRSVLEAAGAYPGECETILVDDASQDQSVALVAGDFPAIQIVRHVVNRGFSEAVQTGIASARHPVCILLNTDVRPEPEFIAPLVRWFEQESTFAVSPLISDPDGHPQRVSWNRVKIVRGDIRKCNWDLQTARDRARKTGPLKSLYASGGSVAIRKAMFLQLGGFLGLYKPFYYEDRDLCTRAWQRGWATFFEPAGIVIHDDRQGTIKRFFAAPQIKIIKRRNRFFYLWLHLSARRLMCSHLPWILWRLPLRLVRGDTVYVRALGRALCTSGEIIQRRQGLRSDHGFKSLEDIIVEIDA
ncbi:MAG: glycosyltransferase [Desulfobacterales bacterium]|nr:MAG: glycosyltransferase [Desulfobacterales bacterium]